MRDYAKVGPKAWHGQTFKALRKRGSEPLIVGFYLMTSPSSNMLGLYAQPILYMAHETGLGQEGAWKGLQTCIEVGFCSYDQDSEMVWVHEMAKYQIAPELKASDLRCKGIQKDYDALPDNPFLGPFFDRYAVPFHMSSRRDFLGPRQGAIEAPSQAPSKPRTGAGEGTGTGEGTRARKPSASSPAKLPTCQTAAVISLYHEILPDLPKVKLHTKDRVRAITKVWTWVLTSRKSDETRRAETADQALQWFREYFERASANDFLMGRTKRNGEHANWRCDLDFLLTDRGMKHVIEKTIVEDHDEGGEGKQ